MIGYQAENHLFTLHTRSSSYQFMVDPSGYLLHTYYGPRVGGGSFAYRLRQADRGFSPNPNSEGHTRTFSLDTQPQEYPSSGVGDFRIPVLEVENADGSRAADLRYQSHVIRSGKYALPGLPAFFAQEEDAQTLEITLEDPVTGLRAVLYYGVIESRDMITRAVRIENAGDKPVALTRVMSLCLDLHQGDLDLITFDGRHTGERHPHRRRLAPGIQMVSSTRGATSHQHNNFIMLCAPDAGETHGWCLGAALVYSGNFEAAVERTQFDTARMTLGISPWQFRFTLAPGETFTAPEAVMIFSREGFSGMTHQFHRAIRDNLCRGEWAHRRRPVLLNTWEAAYFDFDSEKLLEIARCAAETGVELLVMDDGWFGTRNDDRGGLGDWFVNEQKLPGGLAPLVHAVNELGLDFGLWIEPEMVSEDSRLFAEHPDWALRIPGRPAIAEELQVMRDVMLSKDTGARVHICHISTAGTVDIIRRAKAEGISVTCETCPQYFTLIEEEILRQGAMARVNPPLRTASDRDAILEGLKDGTIDAIVTDHAPHCAWEKAQPLEQAPSGMVGLETSLGLALTYLYHAGHMSLMDVINRMSTAPAALLRLPKGTLQVGQHADLVIFHPDEVWTVDRDAFASKGRNTPFHGFQLQGKVKYTISMGQIIYQED